MKLDIPGRRIDSIAIVEAVSTLDRLGQISLDFVGSYAITAVRVGGAATPWATEGNKLVINLPGPVNRGQTFSVQVDYNGIVQPIRSRYAFFSELGLNIREDGTAYAVSQPDGARAWFPCNDHPLDKARFRFEVTVAPPLVGAATGTLIEERDTPEGRLSVWEMRQPMATYLASVFVAPYERLNDRSPNGLPLRHYVYPERRADAERLFGLTGPAIEWFVERLGRYPFEQFGFAMVSLRGASLETQALVLLSERMLTEGTLIHELAHMWFGNSVSIASWADIWRNEGFATYFTTLWEQREGGEEGITRFMRQLEDQLAERPTSYPLGDPPPGQLFGPASYFMGAWVVHMLRHEMGNEAFFRALRAYFERYEGRTATRAEFEGMLREGSGKDLTPFFKRWLDTPGVPTLNITWTTQRINGVHALDVQVCQTAGLNYPADLELLVQGDNGVSQLVRVPLSGLPRTTLTIPFAPTAVVSDPNERLLAKETVEKVDTLAGCP